MMILSRRQFLTRSAGMAGALTLFGCDLFQRPKPNIIFLLTDDQRWEKIFDHIGEASAVFQGGADNGGFNTPRQENVFYYLCGVENPHAYPVLNGKAKNATLYLPESHSGDGRISRDQHFVSLLTARHPRAEIRDISPLIDKMRTIKSERVSNIP